MIDWHCHLLPGIDDGPIDVSESIAMAARLADFGWRAVCCTPHCIKGYYDHTPQQVREATLMLQADLDNAGIRLELWPGMEYMLDECFADYAASLMPLGKTRLVLCEAPQQSNPYVVVEGLQRILSQNFVPLVAHPERTEFFYEILTKREAQGARDEETLVNDSIGEFADSRLPDPGAHRPFWKKLLSLRPDMSKLTTKNSKLKTQNSKLPKASAAQQLPEGCLFHANLGSFTGFYGADVQRRAYRLLKAGVYNCVASDLHDGRSASAVLVRDKFETNPLLQQLAGFDGTIPDEGAAGPEEGQGRLF